MGLRQAQPERRFQVRSRRLNNAACDLAQQYMEEENATVERLPNTASIRFSLSRCNTEAEVDRIIAAAPPIIAQLRKLSPYCSGSGPVANPEQAFQPEYS